MKNDNYLLAKKSVSRELKLSKETIKSWVYLGFCNLSSQIKYKGKVYLPEDKAFYITVLAHISKLGLTKFARYNLEETCKQYLENFKAQEYQTVFKCVPVDDIFIEGRWSLHKSEERVDHINHFNETTEPVAISLDLKELYSRYEKIKEKCVSHEKAIKKDSSYDEDRLFIMSLAM